MTGRHRAFRRLVERRAGDTLRAVVAYDDATWTALYVRDDVRTDELRAAIETLIQRARDHEPMVPHETYGGLGETQATAELHEDGVVLLFRETSTDGVIVSLDQAAARELATFVDACTTVLNDP